MGDLIVFDDAYYMRLALDQARCAFDAGEVPVGAVAVLDGAVIARAGNSVEMLRDATAHAEMLALSAAAEYKGDWRMEDVTIYVTKEPCAMCAGAMVNARVGRVVYGMSDPRSGACGSALDVTGFAGMLWHVRVTGGILAEEAGGLMREFFQKVRKGDIAKKGSKTK